MRIASYNLYEGAQDTYSQLQQFVQQQALDVLCLQETNEWNAGFPTRIDDFSVRTGFANHIYGDSNTRFKLATFSRLPIISSEVITSGFWHSAVKTTVEHDGEPLDIWNVHLNPQGEDKRITEVEKIISLADARQRVIITGDFNSLSAADKYPDDLFGQLAARGITKFGAHKLHYDVTDRLRKAGFADAAVELGANVSTVPTLANQDAHHAAKMRLDYMFVSSGLAKAIKKIEVPKTTLTNEISDHYPVVLDVLD
jgi:exodeoxyribonuclease-3